MTNITHNAYTTLKRCCMVTLLLLSANISQAQFSVSPNKTASQLANAMIGSTSGITILNPTLNCPAAANGTYNNTPGPILGVGNGILLTTGSAANIDNPGSFFDDTNSGGGGDADLQSLSGASSINDACVLEFDLVPLGDSIKFNYQFGSEEYNEWVCNSYNDVFGFFISGPGYAAPTNIAIVPGTNIPVAINTVNMGNNINANCTSYGPGSPFTSYFIDNDGSANKPAFDGYTTIFTARAKVTPCQTYHLKLGVGDAIDRRFTSGVFLEAGSLTILPPVITGCPGNISSCNTTVSWTPPTVAGNCLNITGSTVSHQPGSTFPIGNTTVTYTFTNAGGTSTCSFVVTVYPNQAVTPVPSNATYTGGNPNNIYLGYGPQSATLNSVAGPAGTTYSWTPGNNLSCTNCPNPVFTPTVWGTYTYTVTATYPNGCQKSASVTMCVKEARVNGWEGRAVWVCHKASPTAVGQNQITLLANVPQHIGPHVNDFLGRCDGTCINPDGPDRKPLVLVPSSAKISLSPNEAFAVTTYPNPFTNDLHLSIESTNTTPVDIVIYDIAGKVLETIKHQAANSDIVVGQKLSSGIYFINVTQNGVSQKARVVKVK